ncbi:MAG: PAS domain S-box protein [Bacteroidetes bacterium]|nr:PAS domain S-box protein [Bacteroidota bacterium]
MFHKTIQFNNLTAFGGILLFFLSLTMNVQAQEGIQQRFFTSQNGLKISWVNSITKSQNNTVTIVHSPTFDLARFDGYNFNYTINPSVILGKTYEDLLGNLWSIDEGNLEIVNLYSNDKWKNLVFDAGIPFIPTPGMGNKLLFIRDGDLKEFDKVKEQTRIIKRAEESQIGQFIDMTTFQDGSVWITGEDGVAKFLAQCDTCYAQEQWIDFQVPKTLGLYHFNKPFEGENGELTLMSKSSKSKQNVLAGFNGKMWEKLYTSQTDQVHYGWRGHDNSLWIIKGVQPPPPLKSNLKDWNLFHIQQGKETLLIKNRTLNRVLNDVVVEPGGAFWLATGSGLSHFTPTLWSKIGAGTDLIQHFQKIHEDLAGRLWFASGDSFFLWSNDKWESYQFNPVVFTGDVCSLKDGLLIVGISETGGLALFNPVDKSSTVTFPFGNEKIRYYDQDKDGNCFIILQDLNGTSKLIRYDGEHIETLAVDLKIDGLTPGACEVTDIIQSRNEDIWIVTFTDVILCKKGIKKRFDLKKEFEWTFSTSILELENGNIWVSGSKGIIQYDGGNWLLIQSPEFETARKMILSKDSSIWVASGTGIHRLVDGSWVSNSSEEGLPNTAIFDILEDKQGEIWAATNNGAFCYHPEVDTNAPETVIPADMNSHEAIPSGELQFVFEGRDKWDNTLADRLQYSYRFDENSWTPFENKTIVRGVGLSTGPHVFEVRAMDRNGNIDLSPASWPFTVMLPWYLEAYFIILLAFSICILILLIGFGITRHRQVEKLVLVRTAELGKAKEKAEESDERHKFLFDNTIQGVVYQDPNGEITYANKAAERILGLSLDQMQGRKSIDSRWKAIHEDWSKYPGGTHPAMIALQTGEIQSNKIMGVFSPSENDYKWIKINSVPKLKDGEEKPTQVVSTFEDITAIRKNTKDLFEAKERAEESDRLKSSFLANMSHEIRTPMNGILGFSELLKEPGLSGDEQKDYIDIIELSGERMLNTINNLIEMSKIEAGQSSVIISKVVISKQIGELVAFFQSEMEKKGVDFSCVTLKHEPELVLMTDSEKFFSILTNLIRNASKYTLKGSIKLGYQKKEDYVEFFVKDTGIGIPEEYHDSIFKRFVQVEMTKARKFEGSGLGLAITKANVELLGGKIWFESEENKGSIFYFSLPLTIKS